MKELEELAETVKRQLQLDYDAKSVQFIEAFIERQRDNFDKEGRIGLINSLGSFVGQCIINNYGGQWKFDDETQTVCIAFDASNKVFPFAKTAKQFDNGLEDSVYSFYAVIPTVFALEQINRQIADDNSAQAHLSSGVKKWWKFW